MPSQRRQGEIGVKKQNAEILKKWAEEYRIPISRPRDPFQLAIARTYRARWSHSDQRLECRYKTFNYNKNINMTIRNSNNLEIKKLRELYKDSPAARAVLDHLASRERNWSSTTVDRIQTNVVGDGGSVSRADVVSVFRVLEASGCGSFKAGRKGWPSRFEWAVQMVSACQAAAGETEVVDDLTAEDKGEEDGAIFLRHTFRLRPDVTVSFELPSDLSANEAQRVADFLKTVPFTVSAGRP